MPDTKKPARRGIGCLLVALVGVAMMGVLGLSMAGLAGPGAGAGGIIEVTQESASGATKKLAIIDISGVLVQGSAGLGRGKGVTGMALKMLERAEEDPAVAGVLLTIDTPGGSVTDADRLHHLVGRLKEKGKPVIVHMGDLCASGGYYVAVAADEIWALPTSLTGSIGVIIQSLNLYELMQRHGVTDQSITSGANKAILSPTRPMSPEQRNLLQSVVDEMHETFVAKVVEGRELEKAVVEPLADGRIFTAKQALKAKLIDGIGYRDRALEMLRSKSDGGPFNVVRYRRKPSVFDVLGGEPVAGQTQALVSHLLQTPRAMYIFSP